MNKSTGRPLVDQFTYFADFERIGNTLPPRSAPYLSRWRVNFETAATIPIRTAAMDKHGFTSSTWMMWGAFPASRVPEVGDTVKNIRLIRTGKVVKRLLSIVQIMPVAENDLYQVILSEAQTR